MKIATQFKVVSVSSNTNSFGLYGVIMVAKDGTAYEVGINYLGKPNKGQVLNAAVSENGNLVSLEVGYEIPRKLPTAPQKVVKEIWK
jgi:hypothetical protein